MIRRIEVHFFVAAWVLQARLLADNNPPPSQSPYAVNPPYVGAGLNQPFPDANYGADHGGSSITLSYPFTSPFGYTDHSRGVITYYCAPFTPRSSEGVYGMDVWLEQLDGSGNWNVANLNGGVPDQGYTYQPVNTPNPGPSPSYTFTWTFRGTQLPPNTNFRIFVYVYLYNQGGGGQGNFYVASSVGTVNTGAANDAPRISWSTSFGSTNPTQVQSGQTYTISADGQDDNGNLVAVSINKNRQPFAYAGGGTGFAGNSENPTSDPVGTETYTAWATDSYGAQSPVISWTVNVVGKSNQAPVGSSNVSFSYFSQAFAPSYSGGSGSGAWQFCISGYTGWDSSQNQGTNVNYGGGPADTAWVTAVSNGFWGPALPVGSYSFYVQNNGDANYNPSGPSGPYSLTITPAAPVGYFDSVSPNPVTQGQTISGNGWAADAQLGAPLSSVVILVDGGAGGSFSASLGGSRPDVQSANTSWGHWSPNNITNSGWSFGYNTAGLGQGGHTFTAVDYDNTYGVSAAVGSQNFTVSAPFGQTVTIVPTFQAIYPGQAVTFTASGGVNGYLWGGSASGGGNSQTVTFPSVGNYSVTVYSPVGNGYSQSNTATATVNVTDAGQTVLLTPPSATISAGQSVYFAASGGQNGYVWGGAASGSGASQFVSFPNVGTYTVTVYSPAGGRYAVSNTASAPVTVTPAGQTVSIAPANPTIYAGQSVVFTANGGVNGYVWGGAAGGSGSSQTVTFLSGGTYAVTVYSPAGGNFAQSNTAVATINVAGRPAATLTATPVSIILGQSSAISASYTTDAVHGDSLVNTVVNVVNPQGTETNLSGFGANPIYATFTPGGTGTYTFKAYAETSLAPAWTVYATTTVAVTVASQLVGINPTSAAISAGEQVAFTATGGSTGYVWGGSASGGGSSQTVLFPKPGTFTVTVYAPANSSFAQSNLATATVAVSPDSQAVVILPQNPFVTVGGSIQFTATGGQNGYVWGGLATGSGASQLVSFPNVGTYTVTAYSPRGGAYALSNTATATITVTPARQTVSLAPASPTIYAGQSVAFTASGGMNGYVWGGSASGSGFTQTVTFANAGTYGVTVYSPAGGNFAQSNTATATVTVNSLPSPSSAQVTVTPQGGEVKVQNKDNTHNSQILVPGP